MSDSSLAIATLTLEGQLLFEGVAPGLTWEPAPLGGFLRAERDEPAARFKLSLGRCASLARFVACFRYEPFWMKPQAGSELSKVPIDTQFLLLELKSGKVALVVPLVDAPFKVTLQGNAASELVLVLDSGDPELLGAGGLAAYLAVGDDPHALCREGARIVAERLGSGRLRRDKQLPALVDYFGWCTWDAFYQEVSHDKVKLGLESFRAGGVEPKLLILDDGWQSVRKLSTGGRRLSAFAANEKFPGGLRETVKLAKETFGVARFLVWHTVHGYWSGIDAEALPSYGVENTLRWYSPEVLSHMPAFNWEYWGPTVGRPSPEGVAAFYDDYHRYLAAQGVDGVKVDNQASVEGLSIGAGGRVALMRATRRALEQSTRRHFEGELINCMSCSSEMFYFAHDSSLTRSSTDFWPEIPASHGLHVYTNAMVGLWFGEFVHPDWDMFQSGHAAGAYHAAARAVSGSAVYVSDKPEAHDFALLKQLVLSDGTVLRAEDVGVPARDSLFADPLTEPVLFKVVNRNRCSTLVGAFNVRHVAGENRVTGFVSAADVPGESAPELALYLKRADRLLKVTREERIVLELDALEQEIATFAPLSRGVAALGLCDKLNGGGAVLQAAWAGERYVTLLRDGGSFLAFSERQPKLALVDGKSAAFSWAESRLLVQIEGAGEHRVELGF